MDVKQWIKESSDDERSAVAAAAGTTVAYLWQLAGNHRKPSPKLAIALEVASRNVTPDRVILRTFTRPDIYEPPLDQSAA